MASIVSAGTTSATSLNLSADTSGVLQLASNNGTVALTVDTSQNIGAGTASPSTRLDVATGVGGTQNIATLRSGNVQIKIGTTDIGNGEAYYNVFPTSNSSAAGAHIWQGGGTNLMKLQNNGVLQFNSGYGSVANAYGCRAWANAFGGRDFSTQINASGNVSSITRNSSGNYTFSFTTAMVDINYSAVAGQESGSTTLDCVLVPYTYTTTTLQVISINGGTQSDFRLGAIAIFR